MKPIPSFFAGLLLGAIAVLVTTCAYRDSRESLVGTVYAKEYFPREFRGRVWVNERWVIHIQDGAHRRSILVSQDEYDFLKEGDKVLVKP